MQKLLVSATQFEVQSYLDHFSFQKVNENQFQSGDTSILISGIGLTETTLQLTQFFLRNNVELVLQAGIAGAYDKSLQLGQLVEVISEQYGDLGAEDAQQQLSLKDISLKMPDCFQNGKLNQSQPYSDLEKVSAISVNLSAGNARTIKNREEKFSPQIESMEGLALFRVCKELEVPFTQIRAISNYVEVRNKANWKMDLAIQNLNDFLVQNFRP